MRGLTPLRRSPREDGAVAVIVALMLVVFVAMVAVAVDTGGLYLRRRELVNGSDAAALSAARTCARGGADERFAAPEEAADYQVRRERSRSPASRSAGSNIVSMTPCGLQWGHVSVEYTSQQELFFAPAHRVRIDEHAGDHGGDGELGPGEQQPRADRRQQPALGRLPGAAERDTGVGQTCAFWYDNDRLDGGNFAFLSLNPAGWDVPIDGNCSGAQAGGTDPSPGGSTGRSQRACRSTGWTPPTCAPTAGSAASVGRTARTHSSGARCTT